MVGINKTGACLHDRQLDGPRFNLYSQLQLLIQPATLIHSLTEPSQIGVVM